MTAPVGRTRLALSAVAVVITAGPHAVAAAEIAGWTLHGGFSAAYLEGSPGDFAPDARAGFAGGASARIGFRRGFSIQPGLWWIRKGGETGPLLIGPPGSEVPVNGLVWTLDYVEVPVLARWDLRPNAAVRPYFVAGPAPAFRTGGRLARSGGTIPLAGPAPTPLQRARIFEELSTRSTVEGYRAFDVDLIGGAGIALGRGPIAFELEVRYLRGTLDVLPRGTGADGFNRALVVTAGLLLP